MTGFSNLMFSPFKNVDTPFMTINSHYSTPCTCTNPSRSWKCVSYEFQSSDLPLSMVDNADTSVFYNCANVLRSSSHLGNFETIKELTDLVNSVRNFFNDKPTVNLHAPTEVFFGTEAILFDLSKTGTRNNISVTGNIEKLAQFWAKYIGIDSMQKFCRDTFESKDEKQCNFLIAFILSSLVLAVYQPATVNSILASISQTFSTISHHQVQSVIETSTVPRALLNWLDSFHKTHSALEQYSSSSHLFASYWDLVLFHLFRGHLPQVLFLLESPRLSELISQEYSTHESPAHTTRINEVFQSTISLLKECPACTIHDWDIVGPNWVTFRHKVNRNLELIQNYGSSSSNKSTSETRDTAQLPFEVSEALQDFHRILLGEPESIFKPAGDWIESVIGMVAWWNGNNDALVTSKLFSPRNFGDSNTRLVDRSPALAYQYRLISAFEMTLKEVPKWSMPFPQFRVLELAIECFFAGYTLASFNIIYRISAVVATALFDIAIHDDLLKSCLNLDSTTQASSPFDIVESHPNCVENLKLTSVNYYLFQYASMLIQAGAFNADSDISYGWEVVMMAINRLNSDALAEPLSSEVLKRVPHLSVSTVNRLLDLCNTFGNKRLLARIANCFAEEYALTNEFYGTAILYFFKASQIQKIRETLDLLCARSLSQSARYPPDLYMDEDLRSFLNNSDSLQTDEVAAGENDGSNSLARLLSGYATLCEYFTTCDKINKFLSYKSLCLKLKVKAVSLLLVMICSSADSIKGGLYDPSIQTALHIDCLPLLLGEALLFMARDQGIFSSGQLTRLLHVVEDYHIYSSRVSFQGDALLTLTLHKASPSSPCDDNSSTLDSSALISQVNSSNISIENPSYFQNSYSTKEVSDWRELLDRNATSKDLLAQLRIVLAKEISVAWLN